MPVQKNKAMWPVVQQTQYSPPPARQADKRTMAINSLCTLPIGAGHNKFHKWYTHTLQNIGNGNYLLLLEVFNVTLHIYSFSAVFCLIVSLAR